MPLDEILQNIHDTLTEILAELKSQRTPEPPSWAVAELRTVEDASGRGRHRKAS